MKRNIIIGSRGSDLALWQANHVQALLKDLGVETTIKIIKTQGDKIQDLSFDKLEGKGFFTKEIEEELLDKTIDIAVHSHKDLETQQPKGLKISAVSEREDPSELLLINKDAYDSELKFRFKKNAIVGTSSARRKSQLLGFREDAQIKDLRGNVPTRIQKLRDGGYDAIMLAKAGVSRLKIDLSDFEVLTLDPREFIPAPAQGVLGLQIREDDRDLDEVLQNLNSKKVQKEIGLERSVLKNMDGGCQLPLGVYCEYKEGKYNVWSSYGRELDLFPTRAFYSFTGVKTAPQKIIKSLTDLDGRKGRKVFISRDVNSKSLFQKILTDNSYSVEGESLIKVSSVPFSSIPPTQWIFFSSRNTVEQFYKQIIEKEISIPTNVKIGAIGRGTESALHEKGIEVNFVGQNKDTSVVAQEFNKVLKKLDDSVVLFPQSGQSLRSVQQKLDFSVKSIDLVVYNTQDKEVKGIEGYDYYVFTSPSNAKSFINQYPFIVNESNKVVAIGPTTFSYLKDKGFNEVLTAEYPSEISLADVILSD